MAASHGRRISPKLFPSSLVILIASLAVDRSLATSLQRSPPYAICSGNGNYSINSTFHGKLVSLLSNMSTAASAGMKFYSASSGNGTTTDQVYAQHMCLNYVTNEQCAKCIAIAADDVISLCPNQLEAIVWEESCQLKFSNRDFFGSLDVTTSLCHLNMKNISKPEKVKDTLKATLQNLTRVAASSPEMYSTGKVNLKDSSSSGRRTLYGLVQCGRDLSAEDCITCLGVAIQDVLTPNGSLSFGARFVSGSCYLRYELYAFYDGATDLDQDVDQTSSSSGMGFKVLISAVALTAGILVVVGLLVYYRRRYGGHNQAYDPDNPFISLRTILSATDYFSSSNLLGKGGFGPVYKGVLQDGREVAVKRLSSVEQGVDEFTNEVLLLTNLQHRNLVKLLGFCVEREERMLVYEFMPNSSLDVVLFDPERRARCLDWSRRLNIIEGIARGVLYLHDGSPQRIIHRDLKPNNILLDLDMNAKISDFGMAIIYAGNDAGACTATIVGTYGYMSPEYAMDGIYSTKSDVFSFGVILLEIITGQRNVSFHRSNPAPNLLSYVWRLWSEERGLDLVDPLLKDSTWSPREFHRYLHIGLLCVQVDPEDRPSMSSVARMLKSEPITLRQPERPAFSLGRFTANQEDINSNLINGASVSNVIPR